MRLVEGRAADRFELLGALICLTGAGVILFAPRNA
jgi:small multidrug resistance family-3 protein